MKGYTGQTIQQVMVRYGPPVNAFDMGDGRRAFQWELSSSYVTPTTVTNTGNVAAIGNTAYWTQRSTISGGVPITSTCAYTLYATWDQSASSWRVVGYEKPSLMCE